MERVPLFFSRGPDFTRQITAVTLIKIQQKLTRRPPPRRMRLQKKLALQQQVNPPVKALEIPLLQKHQIQNLPQRRNKMNQVRCPICDKPMNFQARSEWPDFPFCSLRCKRIDLGRWFGEQYKLQGHNRSEDFHEETDEE